MALGFQDCCNSASYFYLNGIPATVSEFETYYIITSQGEKFCATYVEVPALNYQPPTYNLLEMTEFTNCDDCKTSNSYTCPTSESILISQVGAGSIAASDCGVVTIMPLYAECVSVNPIIGVISGSLSVYVTGGTPPYFFYSAGTTTAIGNNESVDNVYPLYNNLPEGTYNIDITDSNNDFLITLNCTLDAAPPELTVSCLPINVSIYGASDGSLNVNALGGTPPYTYSYLGSNVTLPLTNLAAGNYNITVTDSGVGGDLQTETITCTVNQPIPINYPSNLCMRFTVCGTEFALQFERNVLDINFRASYTCTNPSIFGLTSLTISYGSNGWVTSVSTITSQPSFNSFCGVSYIGQIFSLKSFFPTATIPIGTWVPIEGALVGVTPIVVTGSICDVTGVFVSTQSYCTATPLLFATVVLSAYAGTPPYTFNVYNSFINQTSSSSTFSLPGGSYTFKVTDSLGVISDPISFTVPTITGVDVLFGIEACSFGDVTYSQANQLTPSPEISAGEAANLLALVTTTVDFSYLPDGAVFTGKLRYSLDSIFTSGGENYMNPSETNITVTPLFAINEITTNGVTTNILDGVTPEYVAQTFPSFDGTNGTWYKFALGNECCSQPSKEGIKWSQYEYWLTPTFTFNNTTTLTMTVGILTINKVPYLQGICPSSFCGGYLQNSISVTLEDLVTVSGCLVVDGQKALMSYSVQNNSNGVGGWDNPPLFC